MNRVFVQSLSPRFKRLEKKIQVRGRAALRKLKKEKISLDIYLVSDRVIADLNRRFRRKAKSTNVLSFPEPENFPHPETRENYLGEVYLAPDYIRREKEDWEFLLVHGLLHLLGYTHARRNDRIRMERLEKKLLGHG